MKILLRADSALQETVSYPDSRLELEKKTVRNKPFL